MSEIKVLGRIISVICLIGIWLLSLWWAIFHSENKNKNSHVEVFVSRVWLLIHIIVVIIYFVWCWVS